MSPGMMVIVPKRRWKLLSSLPKSWDLRGPSLHWGNPHMGNHISWFPSFFLARSEFWKTMHLCLMDQWVISEAAVSCNILNTTMDHVPYPIHQDFPFEGYWKPCPGSMGLNLSHDPILHLRRFLCRDRGEFYCALSEMWQGHGKIRRFGEGHGFLQEPDVEVPSFRLARQAEGQTKAPCIILFPKPISKRSVLVGHTIQLFRNVSMMIFDSIPISFNFVLVVPRDLLLVILGKTADELSPSVIFLLQRFSPLLRPWVMGLADWDGHFFGASHPIWVK